VDAQRTDSEPVTQVLSVVPPVADVLAPTPTAAVAPQDSTTSLPLIPAMRDATPAEDTRAATAGDSAAPEAEQNGGLVGGAAGAVGGLLGR
jgi:hypothetical protein